MTFGAAPMEQIETLQGFDSGDLGKHGVFETYFCEFQFQFGTLVTGAYNSADDPGKTLGSVWNETCIYLQLN